MRVLIVEDQPDIAAVTTSLLWQLGHETVVAATGHEAMLVCRYSQPQLILMDMVLPDMDGYEVARLLRSRGDLTNVRVWAVTSLPDDKLKRDDAGIVGYLQKPISVAQIHELIGTG
jgi:CheY-like chemotaxis protein